MTSTLSGNDFDSCFPPLNSYCSASKLGLPNSGVPIILQRENAMIVSGSKSGNHTDKSLCVPVVHNSLGKVNLFDYLEAATIPHNEHLEILEGDTPTVTQIKNLTNEVSSLRNELKAKDQLIESLWVKDSVPMAGQNSGLSWEDKVSSPEVHSRMKLQYFPPAVEGATVRVSPPKHVETHGAEKWKDCIVAKESVQPATFMRVPQAKVWAVKKTVTEACAISDIPGLQNTPKEPKTTIPCANQFSALQDRVIIGTEMELSGKEATPAPNVHESDIVTLETSDPLIVSDKGNSVETVNPIVNFAESCDDQGVLPVYDFLPHDLGVGISDLDAVFQALTEMEQVSSKQAKGAHKPGGGRQARKPKKK
ncbi:hypothetical protein RHMOL_Rhmol07G0138100 [Rhododendron molle]|uniref:Uncharacterized protein n=1 Tax=Rhododendron molle TaxID=49168 RepID=A0ACC0N105_RHOML|nr:hypothetical protein RHMOL_Rhmol07G0138100 [Rhododendron molle]